MHNQNLVRGLFLIAVALAFGLGALRYSIGDLARAGPGLFPLLVSSLLLLLGILMVVQSRLVAAVPLYFNLRNIALVLLALGCFVVASKLLSTVVGIVLLVFVASLAGTKFSWKRALQTSVGLILVALAFQKFLGLNLRVI